MFVVTYDKTRNWHSFYVVSDYDKMKYIWRVPVDQVAKVFRLASKDYLTHFSGRYNEKKDNYDVVDLSN